MCFFLKFYMQRLMNFVTTRSLIYPRPFLVHKTKHIDGFLSVWSTDIQFRKIPDVLFLASP